MFRLPVFFVLGLFSIATAQSDAEKPTGTLQGLVQDSQTMEPLIGVNIYLPETENGTTTQGNGTFTLKNIPAGVHNVRISYVGYETQTLTDVVIYSNKTRNLSVKLTPTTVEGETVTVSAGYFSKEEIERISSVSFNPEEIRRSPGAGQELSRILNTISGVATTGETSQDLYVRGGSVNENAFYIDNIPVPAVRHFEQAGGQSNGPIGILNTDLIEDITFSTGGFGASYGDRLSAVGDIQYRDGNPNGFSGKAGLNMTGFLLNAEQGLNEGKSTWLVSARRSYLDIVADALNAGGAPRYEDYQGKVHHKISKNHTVDVLGIYGESLFAQSRSQAIDDGNSEYVRSENQVFTTGLNHTWLWDCGYTKTSASFSLNNNDSKIRETEDRSLDINQFLENRLVSLRSVSFYRLNPKVSLEAGMESSFEWNTFDYFYEAYTTSYGVEVPDVSIDQQLNGSIHAVFASAQINLNEAFSGKIGMRTSVNSYNEELNMSPRLNLSYKISPDWNIFGAAGIYHQTLPRFLLSQQSAFREMDNMRATHVILGSSYMLTDDTNIKLEIFNKQYSNIPEPTENSEYGDLGYVPDQIGKFYDDLQSTGEAYARGVEVMVQKKLAKDFYGLVSASYFRSRYKDYTGTWRNRSYDTRYLINVIGGYRPSDIWEFSVRWSYMGGRPTTPIDVMASQQAEATRRFANRVNEVRLPDFHSLYLRFDRRYFFESFSLVTFMEVWNSYNRSNVTGRYWNTDDEKIDEVEQFSLLPVGGVVLEF